MRPYVNFTDDEVVQEIQAVMSARRKISGGGIAVIAGEGRRVEYAPGDAKQLDHDLRMLEFEARSRGLDIAGEGGAIGVEFR